MNCDMEEKGIVARDGLPPEPRWREALPPQSTTARQPAAGSGQWRFSLLQIDVEVEEPEPLENGSPTHNPPMSAMVEKERRKGTWGKGTFALTP
ncbi:unnamed protein product [Boreogadus saida]